MIFRSEHTENFTIVSNDIVKDERLSDGAFRLLSFMLTCSDSWSFSLGGLAFSLNWPVKKVARLVTELKRCGYIEQKKRTDAKGRFLPSEWLVHEIPVTATPENRRADKPLTRQTAERINRRADEPQSGKRGDITSTNNKQVLIVTSTNSNKDEEKKPLGEFQNVFLTVPELEKLQTKLGNKLNDYIEDLGDYLKTHPKKKYASHYRTILKWYERDLARNPQPESDDTLVDDLMEMARKKGLV